MEIKKSIVSLFIARSKAAGLCLIALLALQVSVLQGQTSDDILLADFEQGYPEGWQVEGESFGPAPYSENLITGYRGTAAAISVATRGTGKLTSAPFVIERRYLNLLIGGGNDTKQVHLKINIAGAEPILLAGKRDTFMRWESVDLQAYRGQRCFLELVDDSTAIHHGAIGIDHLILSDQSVVDVHVSRKLVLDQRYLQFPVNERMPYVWLEIKDGDQMIHKFEIQYAFDQEPDMWGLLDVSAFQGVVAEFSSSIRALESEQTRFSFDAIVCQDALKGREPLYDETQRPQLRFSQRRGWVNDPNGMVYHDGTWHFFYQANPMGRHWRNMYWGHATSKDLVHWEEQAPALRPYVDAKGMCWSGGGVVDHNNSSGLKSGDTDPLLVYFTDTGAGESMAYSLDGGKTFTPHPENPLFKHSGRDPKVFWYEPGAHWVLIIYENVPGQGHSAAIHTSKDMTTWEKQSTLPDFFECMELFELPVPGTEAHKWVIHGADGKYRLGSFDGKTFTPEHEGKHDLFHGRYYAAQNFSNTPDGRVIQVGWHRGSDLGISQSFNQTFSLPMELTLKKTEAGVRLFANPVKELQTLRGSPISLDVAALQLGQDVRFEAQELLELEISFEIEPGGKLGLTLGDIRWDYVADRDDAGVPLDLKQAGRRTLRILVDRSLYEIYVNEGQAYHYKHRGNNAGKLLDTLRLSSSGVTLLDASIYQLRSIWNTPRP